MTSQSNHRMHGTVDDTCNGWQSCAPVLPAILLVNAHQMSTLAVLWQHTSHMRQPMMQGNHIYTSGATGTNAAVIRGALRAEKPDLLTVVLPQSLSMQPPESQELLADVSLLQIPVPLWCNGVDRASCVLLGAMYASNLTTNSPMPWLDLLACSCTGQERRLQARGRPPLTRGGQQVIACCWAGL